MYFYKKKQKHHLDLAGNLIMSKNQSPVAADVKSAVPTLHKGLIIHLPTASKIRATWLAIRFIWTGGSYVRVEVKS